MLAAITAVRVRVTPALLAVPSVGASPLDDGHAVHGMSLGNARLGLWGGAVLQRLRGLVVDRGGAGGRPRAHGMVQDVGRDLVDVADEVGGAQVPAALLIGQVLQDLLSAEVETGAEHLLAVLGPIASLLAWKDKTAFRSPDSAPDYTTPHWFHL